MNETKICDQCEQPFNRPEGMRRQNWHRMRFCGNSCKEKHGEQRRRRQMDDCEQQTCAECGNPIKRFQTYCDRRCMQFAYHKGRGGRREEYEPTEEQIAEHRATAFAIRQSWYAGCVVADNLD